MKRSYDLDYFDRERSVTEIIQDVFYLEPQPAREVWDNAMGYNFPYSKRVSFKKDSIERMMVNHIRHNLSSYDNALDMMNEYCMYEEIANDVGYHRVKNAVLDRIGDDYPYLDSECNKQKSKVNMIKPIPGTSFRHPKKRKKKDNKKTST